MTASISLPFNFTESGAIGITEDPAKVWQDRVIIAVMTNIGERVMRPTFGSDAPKTFSENVNDALAIIRQSVSVAFSRWLPELTLIEVTGFVDEYDDHLVAQIKYNYRDQNIMQTVNIKTAVLSRSGELIREVATNG